MDDDAPFYLVGLGLMELAADGSVKGSQKSSTTAIAGEGAALMHATYTLSGTWSDDGDGTLSANITFQSAQQTMTGTFDMVPAGTDRFWLISSGSTLAPGNQPIDEVVQGEAVRIG
jgi:hypothetical protein